MRKCRLLYLSLFIGVCAPFFLRAQYKVRIVVKEMTAIQHDSIYLSGSFNNWDSLANKNYKLAPLGPGEKTITLNLPAGNYEYKITRGNWLTVEKEPWGNETPNHVLKVSKDIIVRDTVWAWRDMIFADRWHAIAKGKSDTIKVSLYSQLANLYTYPEWYNSDSALGYIQKALLLLHSLKASNEFSSWTQNNYAGWLFYIQESSAKLLHSLGNYPKALELRLQNLKLAEEKMDHYDVLWALSQVNSSYAFLQDFTKALGYSKKMEAILNQVKSNGANYETLLWNTNYFSAEAYYHLKSIDSALYYGQRAEKLANGNVYFPLLAKAHAVLMLGNIYSEKGNKGQAFAYYKNAIQFASQAYLLHVVAQAQEGIAKLFKREAKIDSALYYAQQSLLTVSNHATSLRTWGENEASYIVQIAPLIAGLYKEANEPDSAYRYLKLSIELKDSLYNADKIRQVQNLTFNESIRQQQQEQATKEAKQQYDTRIKISILVATLVVTALVAFFLYKNNKNKMKANKLLQKQKAAVEWTLEELKTTQLQLVQREKMASLGELTAGIAHEIQNPLNFVNNFSAVNKELFEEMEEELEKGNINEAKAIAHDIKGNEEKIAHHGRRAETIVKGMLQHSRANAGDKEPTDINALAEEYLRLSYHGLRAKDKSFNATIQTDFDKSIDNISVVPQEIGRVLLNLYNNAFYAVSEKKKRLNGTYEPMVAVCTIKEGNGVKITIRDNGSGIPPKVVDKVFQPFFTTKPSGEGTGLGLSLSYDIITKGHGGELKVESQEGEGTAFVVQLPQERQ